MSNIQKAFKTKANLQRGMRASDPVCMADGGFLRRVVNTIMPGTKNVNEPANVNRINNAIEQQTAVAPAPAPAPAAPEPEAKPFRFARGGQVHGPGTGTSDSIPARLSDGEFVMPADSVQAIGAHNLEAMRQATHTPVNHGLRHGYVNGGQIKPGASGDWDSEGPVAQTVGTSLPAAAGVGATRSGLATARDVYNAGDGLNQARTPGLNMKAAGVTTGAMPTVEQVAGRAPGLLTTETVPVNQAGWAKNAADFTKATAAGDAGAANVARGALAGKAASEGLMTKAAPGMFTKVAAPLGAGFGAYQATKDAMKGDYGSAGLHGLDAAASAALATPFAPAAGVYLGGRAGYSLLDNGLSDRTKENIGGTINSVMNKVGLGVDDSEYLKARAQRDLAAEKAAPKSGGASGDWEGPRNATATPNAAVNLRSASPVSPVSPTEQANANNGLSADTQRAAVEANPVGLRGGPQTNNISGNPEFSGAGMTGANANLRQSVAGMQDGQAYQVSNSPNSKIYATKDGNGQLVLTGAGNDQAGSGDYTNSAQYQQGVARAQADKAELAAIEGKKERDAQLARAAYDPNASIGENFRRAGLRKQIAQQQATDVAREGHRMSYDASMYGHQVSAQNAKSMRQFEAAKLGLEQQNKNREFSQKQQEQNLADRSKAQKDLNDQLGTMFTTKDDKGNVVPDAARVASASQKILDELGARVADLRKVPKTDPNYAQSQQLADHIAQRGLAALEPDDVQELLSQVAIRDRALATKSLLPGGSSPKDSRLSGYGMANKSGNLIGSDTITLRNGTRIRANDLRYTEPANAILPDLGHTPTDQFEAGLKARK